MDDVDAVRALFAKIVGFFETAHGVAFPTGAASDVEIEVLDRPSLLAKMAAGMSAGAIGQAIAVPCDLIKVRMQGDGRLVAAGKLDKPRYTGLFDAFSKIKVRAAGQRCRRSNARDGRA